ncbi:MAG: hypothetical protein QOG99_831 [Frankiales bacterium]|jgi:hypothetical protein|nr:hypothetical protein [Frankiales bacterium]
MNELELQLKASLRRVADATPVTTPPMSAPPRTARRRIAAAGALCLGMVGTGVGVAAANGQHLPCMYVFCDNGKTAYSAIPGTEQHLLVTDGPFHRPLELWFASATHHGWCVAIRAPARAAAELFEYGGGCGGPVGGGDWNRFGGAFVAGSGGPADNAVFAVHVPHAAAAVIRLGDGSTRTAALADDWSSGWFTGKEWAGYPVLVGYDAHGQVIGQVALHPR